MKNRKFIIPVFIIILGFLTNESLMSQLKQEWIATYNGTGNLNDGGPSLAVDGSGNVYVTGTTINAVTHEDFVTIKYNSSGTKQWAAVYDGPVSSKDYGLSVVTDDSGYVYVTGSSTGSGTLEDIVTIKYNSSGDSLWVRRYNGPGDSTDKAKSVKLDGSGNVCVSGSSIGKGTTYDYTAIKYSPSGEQLWVARYNGPGNDTDWVSSMAADNSGNVYLTGASMGKGTYYDYATIKYGANGAQLWTARYDGEKYNDGAVSIVLDGAGDVYVTGNTNSDFGLLQKMIGLDIATIKYSPEGRVKWVRKYESRGNKEDVAQAAAVDDSENVYVTGTCGQNLGGAALVLSDLEIIKYNKSGDEIWAVDYGMTEHSDDVAEAMAVDKSGNIFISGYSEHHSDNYLTVMMNSSGKILCSQSHNGSANNSDMAFSVAVDSSGNVYVTGDCENTGSGLDIVTIKYSK